MPFSWVKVEAQKPPTTEREREKMIVKKELLQAFLDKYGITAAILAREMHVDENEIKTLLDGGAVNEETARKFIYYFGADEAMKMIDWAALGKQIPNIGEG